MELTQTIFLKAFQYSESEITLEELENWLVPRLPYFLAIEPCAESELAGAIELGLAEMSTEEEFRAMLQEVIKTYPMFSKRKAL